MATKADTPSVAPPESATTPTLRQKLMAVMAGVDRLTKTGYNEAQRYKYLEASAVFEAVRSELVKAGVLTLVDVDSEETIQYTTTKGAVGFFTHIAGRLTFMDDSASLVVGWRGAGSDSGDKGLYKAITSGLKYALYGSFLIPTGEDVEASEPPRFDGAHAVPKVVGAGITEAQRRMLMARMREAGLEGDQRKVLVWLVAQKHSTKDLTPQDLDALLSVLDDPTNEVNADFLDSARMVQPVTGPSPHDGGGDK